MFSGPEVFEVNSDGNARDAMTEGGDISNIGIYQIVRRPRPTFRSHLAAVFGENDAYPGAIPVVADTGERR